MSKRTPKREINGKIYYYKSIELGIDPLTGKRKKKVFYAEKVHELNKKIEEYNSILKKNMNPDSKETLGEYIEYYLKEVHFNKGVKNSTIERYWGIFNNYIVNVIDFLTTKRDSPLTNANKLLIKEIPLNQLTARNIQEYYNTLYKNGVSIPTLNYIGKILKPCIKNAYVTDRISKDYTIGLIIPKDTSLNNEKKIDVFTREELSSFLEAIKGHKDEALFKVAIYTGLRLGELLGIKWSCIDFEEGTLTVNNAVRREKDVFANTSELTNTTLKNRYSYDTLYIPEFLLEILKYHKETQLKEQLRAGNLYINNDYVFCTPLGKAIEPSNLRKRYKKILETSNIPYRKFHTFRHTLATRLMENGESLLYIQSILRHGNSSTTLDIYTHFTNSQKRTCMNNINKEALC